MPRLAALPLLLLLLAVGGGCRKRPLQATWTKAGMTDVQWQEDREILMKTKGRMELHPKLLPGGTMLLTVIYDERKQLFVETQLMNLGYTRQRTH